MPDALSGKLLLQARAEIDAGDIERAVETLDPFTQAKPPTIDARDAKRSADFWRDAGETLGLAGMAEAAEAAWRRAETHGLSPLAARLGATTAWLIAGAFDRALEESSEPAAAHPKNGTVRNLRAIALFENERHDEAFDEWKTALKYSAQIECPLSTHPTYLSLGAMALERHQQSLPIDAPSTPTETKNERPPGWTANSRLARIEKAIEKGEFARALVWIEAELPEKLEDTPEMLVLLHAWTLAETGRWNEARARLLTVLEFSPHDPTARSFLARCLTRLGDPTLALRLLDGVATAGPDDFFANYYTGCARLALNQRVEALGAFRRAFTEFFFDTYHYVLLPLWEKTAAARR